MLTASEKLARQKAIKAKLAELKALQYHIWWVPALERKERKRKPIPRPMVAYDFETTRIEKGTPRPLYITGYGDKFHYASPIANMADLHAQLERWFLTEETQTT